MLHLLPGNCGHTSGRKLYGEGSVINAGTDVRDQPLLQAVDCGRGIRRGRPLLKESDGIGLAERLQMDNGFAAISKASRQGLAIASELFE
jgi:hypothetical protein